MTTLNLELPASFEEYSDHEKIDTIKEVLDQKFKYIGEGTTRRVYEFDNNYVLKCPLHPSAVDCNIGEQSIYDEESFYNDRYCHCETIIFHGVPLLLMEKVTPYEIESDFTWDDDWRLDITDAQVGLTKDGKIKAFDFCQF